MIKQRKRDWHTPLLLTLSLHMLAFTLFINHRLFSMIDEPRIASSVTRIAALTGDDPESEAQENDEGAAPGEQTPQFEPAAASVSDIMREIEQPVGPPPERTPTEKPGKPVESRPLSDRLAASANASAANATPDSSARLAASGAAGSRGQGRRADGLRKHGGGADTEDAVTMGLRWLASVQDHDGRWDSDGYMVHYVGNATHNDRMAEGIGMGRNDIGITGLCMLAFTGAGHSDVEGTHSGAARRARQWLLSRQRVEDGGFGLAGDPLRNTFYEHSIATLALADLYLLTADESLRAPIQRAAHYLCKCQGEAGGWDYPQFYPGDANWRPPTRNDLSISGWAVLALIAAREGGLAVPRENLDRAVRLLREQTRPDGEAVYATEGIRAFHRGASMMAVSNLCRRLLGEPGNSETQRLQHQRIADQPPDWKAANQLIGSNMYYWYYGSLALLIGRDQPGGEDRWRQWNIALKKTLLPNQVQTGPRRGSFDPDGDYWAHNGGGRLYSTALCVLTLEIYYRYEPDFLRARAAELTPLWSGE
jgi:hypothetical protein